MVPETPQIFHLSIKVLTVSFRCHCFVHISMLYSVPYSMMLQDSEASIGALLGKQPAPEQCFDSLTGTTIVILWE